MKEIKNGNIWNDIKKITAEVNIAPEKWNTFRIILFGAAMNGSFAYERLRKQYEIYAFSDNNPLLWGKQYEGVSVIEPSQLKMIDRILVIITTSGQHYLSIKKQLNKMDIPCLTYMEYVFLNHLNKFEVVYNELLEDEFSKKVYENLLISYFKMDLTYLKEVFVRNQYFELPDFYMISNKEIFVDCGAYAGDTLENYIMTRCGCFKKIYSFEPTEKIFNALCVRRERLLKEWALEEEQIVVERKMIASQNEMRYFAINKNREPVNNRIVSKKEKNCKQIEAVSLDEYFLDKEKPTFIKADIEGAEMELLEGAAGIIKTKKPLLAICIYHRIEDLYEIPYFIKKLNSEYKMAIRHHSPSYCETVLYCY